MTDILAIDSAQHTDAGIKMEFHGIVVPDNYQLETKGIGIAIADGVSTSESSREASETCINGLLSDYYSTPDSWTVKTSISKVLNSINQWLYSKTDPNRFNNYTHATTLSGLILKSNTAHIFHIGDSRIYLIRDGAIDQLTSDHRVYVSENESYLKRAMGIDLHLEIDYKKIELQTDDIFILTTDGVHDFIGLKGISEIISANLNDLESAVRQIVNKAIEHKSDDNLTCQIFKIKSLPNPDSDEFFERLTKLPFSPELEAGNSIDKFKVIRQLHASSRSQCYYAVDLESEQKLVLKTPSINFEDDPSYIQSFLQEEWIGKQINSLHVLKVIEQTHERKFLYQIAEFIEGKTLRAWINENPYPEILDVLAIVEEIGKGLRAFHRLEMIHRDLKPENIMLDKHGIVKIIDFGSTKISGSEEILNPLDKNHLVGTIGYTAPEFATGSSGTVFTDQFSLAVICYEMLCGRLPFKGNLKQYSVEKRKYITIRNHTQQVPLWMEGAIKKALSENPESRYNDIDEFVYDLKHPNKVFAEETNLPLIERDPLKFWKGLAFSMIIINIVLIILLQKS